MNKELILAIFNNDTKKVRELLETAKKQAEESGNLKPYYDYLNHQFEPSDKTDHEMNSHEITKKMSKFTPLMLAAYLGSEEIIRLLIKDSDKEQLSHKGFSAFFCAYLHASATKNLAPLKLFLDYGANINQVFYQAVNLRAKCGNALYSMPPVSNEYGTLLGCAIEENKPWEPTLYLFEAEKTEVRNYWINHKRYEYHEERNWHPTTIEEGRLSMEKFTRLCEAIERSTVITKLVLGCFALDQDQLLRLFKAISKNNSITSLDMNWLSEKTKWMMIREKQIFEALVRLVENKPNIKEVIFKNSLGWYCTPRGRSFTNDKIDYDFYARLPLAIERNNLRNVLHSWSRDAFEFDPFLSDPDPQTEPRSYRFR